MHFLVAVMAIRSVVVMIGCAINVFATFPILIFWEFKLFRVFGVDVFTLFRGLMGL